jgi:hypothetical protein
MTPLILQVVTNVSREPVASIFKAENKCSKFVTDIVNHLQGYIVSQPYFLLF